jgi:ribonuclease G
MSKDLVISTSPHETRVAILENGNLVEIYVEREKEYALVGSIYKGRVTRVLPGMQSAFVDVGLDTDAFLYVSDVLEEIEEYDHIVSTVEEKVAKMEEQGGHVFAPPSGAPAEEPPEVTGNVEPIAPPPVTPPVVPRPVSQPNPPRPSGGFRNDQNRGPATRDGGFNRGPASRDGGFRRGSEQGGFNRGPQRGGRYRGNRGGRGGVRDDRRQLPSSKYVSPGGYDSQNASRGPRQDSPREPFEPADSSTYEPIILPGESLAKYKGRTHGSAAIPSESAAASSPAAPAASPGEVLADQALDATARHIGAAVGEEHFTQSHAEASLQSPPTEAPAVEERPSHDQPPAPDAPEEVPAETDDQAAFGLTSSAPEAAQPQPGTTPFEKHSRPEEGGKEMLSEAEAAAVLEAAEEDAQAAVIQEDEETRLAEAFPELDAPESDSPESDSDDPTDREIREGILEAAGATEPADSAEGHGTEERTARVHEDPRQRFTRPMHQPQPRRGRVPQGRSHERHQAQRRSQSISDLLKPGQEIIIQIAKEPLGKKGARITSHVALPGRFLVYMPTLEHTGVSRKINSADVRARLRHVVKQYNTQFPGGFIVRTAAESASEEEVRADIEYLGHTWQEIRSRSEQRRAPALLHRDLNLVERVLRDYFSPDFAAIWVDNQEEFTRVVEFIGRFQPALVSRVKLYTKEAPIFEEFGIQQEIDKALRPKVWLKSGGYIVINHTEALVAIDVNTGKFVGKGSNRLEDTIVKANLEACKEIIRQIRLRDLGGIIIVDFIDMEERRNRAKVMQALEEELRDDRAPSKVLGFNEFGLVAITRKRTKQALERVLCQPCPYCTGSGMVKSIHTICYEAQAEARKMAPELDSQSLTLRVHPEIAKALKTRESALMEELERWTKKSIIIHGDPSLHWEQFDIY